VNGKGPTPNRIAMADQQLDLEHFKQRLLALRQELEIVEEIGRDGVETVELDQTRTGRLTRMDAMQAQAMSVAAKIRREAQLR
jgi:DnaK suppressor protein